MVITDEGKDISYTYKGKTYSGKLIPLSYKDYKKIMSSVTIVNMGAEKLTQKVSSNIDIFKLRGDVAKTCIILNGGISIDDLPVQVALYFEHLAMVENGLEEEENSEAGFRKGNSN